MNQSQIQSEEIESADKAIAKIFDDSDYVYETVLSKINLPEHDDVYRELVLITLKRQAKDHMVFAIWNNLDKKQAVHLRDFLAQTQVFAKFLTTDDAVIEFALMYPRLLEKVYASLADFFIDFIEKFNKYLRA